MEKTLHYIISSLVEQKDSVVIEKTEHGEKIVFIISVDPSDMGKIIGKNGRIIRAIRDVVKIMAVKNNTFVDVVLNEDTSSSA